MSILAIDLVDNNDGEVTFRGYKFTRNAIVTSPVEQSGGADDTSRIFEAINDTGVPEIGDAHPSVATCLLKKIYCLSIEPNILTLRLEYETPDPRFQVWVLGQTDTSMEASLIQTETSKKWGTGSEVEIAPVSYTYEIGDLNPAEPFKQDPNDPLKRIANPLTEAFTEDSEQPVVPLYLPAMVLTYKKRKTNTSESELEALNKTYQGAVNNAAWRGYNARTWLCIGLNWRVGEYQKTFLIDLRFQYKFDTFDAEIVYRSSFTGKVPKRIFAQGSAYRRDRIQPEANFDTLLSALGI